MMKEQFLSQKFRSGVMRAKVAEHHEDLMKFKKKKAKETKSVGRNEKVSGANFGEKIIKRNEFVDRMMVGSMRELDPSWLLICSLVRREMRFISYSIVSQKLRNRVLK